MNRGESHPGAERPNGVDEDARSRDGGLIAAAGPGVLVAVLVVRTKPVSVNGRDHGLAGRRVDGGGKPRISAGIDDGIDGIGMPWLVSWPRGRAAGVRTRRQFNR